MADDSHEVTQLVATGYHAMRAQAKKRRKGAPKTVPLHHRAATDWWNFVKR